MQVRQVFDDLGEFVAAYRGRISRQGMLLFTDLVYQPGSQLDVEIRLRDNLLLVRGKAEVVGPDPTRTDAVLLRFASLDGPSADLLERLEQRHSSEGGKPFRLPETPPPMPDERRPRVVYEEVAAALADERPPPVPAAGPAETVEEEGEVERVWPMRLLVVGAAVVAAAAMVMIALLLAHGTGKPMVTTAAIVTPTAAPTAVPGHPVPPEPVATPVVSAPGAEARPTATRVERIDWATGEGRTVVTLELNGTVTAARVVHSRLEDPPRLVIQLLGLTAAYPRYEQEVGGPHLQRIRAWYHGETQPPTQYVVLDLISPGVVASPPKTEGHRVRISLSGGGA